MGRGTGTPAESTAVERTVGGLILRRDEEVLRIDEAELLRAEGDDEIFVRATVKGPALDRVCFLMKRAVWFDFRDAIESGNLSDAPAVPVDVWASPARPRGSGAATPSPSPSKRTPGERVGGRDPGTRRFSSCATRTPTWRAGARAPQRDTTTPTSRAPQGTIGRSPVRPIAQ